jgi:serine/threonine protein kinase
VTVPGDGAKQLVAACLDEADRFTRGLVDRACDENPSVAEDVRKRYAALRAAGLVPDGGAFGVEPDPWSEGAREALSRSDPGAAKTLDAIGPYQPLRELGRGGQAVVYLAEDRRLHRPVALKVLKGLGPLTETMMRRFRREAEVASRLDHHGICAVYDAGVLDGVPYIAMRFVEGDTLADRIEAARKQPDDDSSLSVGSTTRAGIHQVLDVVEKAARALHVAHEAGIVHRDVKPSNIMITPRGEPVLLDFGLAGHEDGDFTTLTGTGESLGTPAYMSPEQLMARRIRVDRRTDVYSLGVTLYECLTLERPFRGGTRDAVYQAIQYDDPTDIRKLNAGLPHDIKVLMETALEKDRDRRYQTAEALADDLARVRRGEPIAARQVTAVERAWRWAKRRPVRAALLAALAVGIPMLTALLAHVVGSQPAIREAERQALRDRIDGHLESGFDALAHADPRAALASFDSALAMKADSVEAISGKALALGRLGDHEGCLSFIDRAGAGISDDRVLRHMKAVALEHVGRWGEAADLENAPKAPVHGALAHFLAGLTLMPDGQPPSHGPGSDYREAYHHFMMAALTAPDARKLYHLALAQAATHVDDPEAANVACGSMRILWPGSALVSLRAAEGLLERSPGTAIAAARAAHALGAAPANSPVPNEEWLASQEERALTAMRKLVDRAAKEKDADPWQRLISAIDNVGQGWQEDLSRGRREAVIRRWLAALSSPPFTGIRSPGDCPGLPREDHDRWRRAWAAIDTLARRTSAPDSR